MFKIINDLFEKKITLKDAISLIENIESSEINKKDEFGCTPFTSSPNIYEHDGLVEAIIKKGGDPTIQDEKGYNALMCSSIFNYDYYIKLVSCIDQNTLKICMEQRRDDKTILMHACKDYDIDIMLDLIERGADIFAEDSDGNTAFTYINCNYNAEQYIEAAIDKYTSSGNNPDEIRYKIVNTKNKQGLTPLMRRSVTTEIYGTNDDTNDDIISLYHMGADPNIQDNCGKTCFHYAVQKGKVSHLVLLLFGSLKYKPDLTIKDNDGKNALDYTNNRNLCAKYLQ